LGNIIARQDNPNRKLPPLPGTGEHCAFVKRSIAKRNPSEAGRPTKFRRAGPAAGKRGLVQVVEKAGVHRVRTH
jgi:hypothetical protein